MSIYPRECAQGLQLYQLMGHMELNLQQFLALLHLQCLLASLTIWNYLAGLHLEIVLRCYLWVLLDSIRHVSRPSIGLVFYFGWGSYCRTRSHSIPRDIC